MPGYLHAVPPGLLHPPATYRIAVALETVRLVT
jgi:hypothetical protein